MNWSLNSAGSYFYLKNHYSKDVNISVGQKQFCILQLIGLYDNKLFYGYQLTITRHVFICIFHTKHFSAVKFFMPWAN